MLDELSFTGRELLIAVVLATVVYLLEVLLFSRRRSAPPVKVRDADLEARLESMTAELAGLRARMDLLEARPPVDSPLDSQGAMYAEAMRMARDGHPPQEMSTRLGISRSEAELITALHKAEP